MALKIATFRLRLKALEELFLPEYKGSALRGGFGHSFRRVVCIQKGTDCKNCILKDRCIYSYIFDTPPPPNSTTLSKIPNAPHPFVIRPPLSDKKVYERGESLDFNLILFGKAIDYLPYVIFTFDELGRIGLGKGKGKFFLEEVYGLDLQGQEVAIYHGKEKTLSGDYHTVDAKEILNERKKQREDEKLTLNFLTPTRIKHEGHFISNLKFHILITNLSRRLWLLSYFHGDEPMEMISKELVEKAKEVDVDESRLYWDDWERYSNRQKTRMNLGGFKGKITFKGKMEEFLPILYLGAIIHVGKGSSFGLGKYGIEVEMGKE